MDQMDADMVALNLKDPDTLVMDTEEAPRMTLAREKLLEEAKRAISGQGDKKLSLSIVIIGMDDQPSRQMRRWSGTGHVDAGKSTLVGRLLYDLGALDQRKRAQTERSSEKAGKASFSWAWEMDSGVEERSR
jgi:elongation factor 1 alpha-like protein